MSAADRLRERIAFVDAASDRWVALPADASAAPSQGSCLVTLPQWQALGGAWPAGLETGIVLANDADVAALTGDLGRFALVALQFPKWNDGRAYSQARLLRRRFGFQGEIRATGEVLVDMLPLLVRCGFDAAALRPDQSLDAARRALGFFPDFYQADLLEPRPRFARLDAAEVAQ